MEDLSILSNAHPSYIDSLYKEYLQNPGKGDPEWRKFFAGFDLAYKYSGDHNGQVAPVAPTGDLVSPKEFRVLKLISGYRNKGQGRQIYLETNGTLPRALERVVEGCDWIAMDIKPESAVGRDLWEGHRWFLRTGENKIFTKMVLTANTKEEELRRVVDLISGVRRDIPLVLQPTTPWGRAQAIPLGRLASWWALATRQLCDVRIPPQVHRLWAIP